MVAQTAALADSLDLDLPLDGRRQDAGFGSRIMQNSCQGNQQTDQCTTFCLVKAVAYITTFPFDAILASHFPHQPKAHLLVDCHIGNQSRTLEVALPALLVRLVHRSLHQLSPNAPSLLPRQYGNDVTEIVPLLIRPEFFLGFCLTGFPNPIPIHTQTAAAHKANIEEALAKPKGPRVERGGPIGWAGRWPWWRPHGNAKDFVR